MKRIGANDIFEAFQFGPADIRQAPYFHNDLHILDQRAKMAVNLIHAWGMAGTMGDAMPVCTEHGEKPKRMAPTELVMRICEVVDAAWNEFERRGWIVAIPSASDEDDR
jgi:hypothetical protein